ncbi:sir2 class like protein [Dothistroma septosporum NZE10]|uniref:Sir2 class like protein n=1 Tax=Dothistroma septosporum (strain NZE10 / CBS 128990) TaxID=675120 RepID=N1Q4D1_DOTSN|nr:sir2 class like protein [Dothistroma septosporum NZE10]
MRIPYTAPLPSPTIIPATASELSGAIDALLNFLSSGNSHGNGKTLVLSGAGMSVASGLADYRGTNGTYTLNKTYRPIYFHEFSASHEARKRYWARSYLGWTTLHRSNPNPAHYAVGKLGELGHVSQVITQNVDSFHPKAHSGLKTLELHGYLRSTVCLTCRSEYSRDAFQEDLSRMNPSWSAFLAEMLGSGALSTEDPAERRKLGLKTNPDGDVDVPGVEYSTFRYPPCPRCLADETVKDGIKMDEDGAWAAGSTAGILKPAVIMFGESIPGQVKVDVEAAVDESSRLLVLGSSLATYSAWRLVKRAKQQGKIIAAINQGGVRGEDNFFADLSMNTDGTDGVRCALPLEETLPALVKALQMTHSWQRCGRPFQPAPWAGM